MSGRLSQNRSGAPRTDDSRSGLRPKIIRSVGRSPSVVACRLARSRARGAAAAAAAWRSFFLPYVVLHTSILFLVSCSATYTVRARVLARSPVHADGVCFLVGRSVVACWSWLVGTIERAGRKGLTRNRKVTFILVSCKHIMNGLVI